MSIRHIISSILISISYSVLAGEPFITVGSDMVMCDYESINEAINNAEDGTEIRISSANQTYLETILIANKNLTLKGGYETCDDAAADNNSGERVSINDDPNNPGPVITISTDSIKDVTLENLLLNNGNGGIVAIDAELNLFLNNIELYNNIRTIGGGIYIKDENNDGIAQTTTVEAVDIIVHDNIALSAGGGIYCAGHNNLMHIDDTGEIPNTGIYNNNATTGAGLRAYDGCTINYYGRGRINHNDASQDGGGIAVATPDLNQEPDGQGGKVFLYGYQVCNQGGCRGNNDHPIHIHNNRADDDQNNEGDGGAVHVTGTGSIVEAYNVKIENNYAYLGGAFAVEEGAKFITGSAAAIDEVNFIGDCWDYRYCNQIINNKAKNRGGVIRVGSNATADIVASYMSKNRANLGTVSAVENQNALLHIESSIAIDNGYQGVEEGLMYQGVFYIFGSNDESTKLELAFVTAANNNASERTIYNTAGGSVNITSSIIYDESSGDVYETLGDAGTELFDCLIVHEDNSIVTDLATRITVTDPMFRDPDNGDYHLSLQSPASDYCDDSVTQPLYSDIDNELRGWDNPYANDPSTKFDIGGDEIGDLIFKNSFH